jgi:4'-phosphopantetheinyl transferase
LKLGEDEVHVWIAFDGELCDPDWLNLQRGLLEPDELQIMSRRRTTALQTQFLIARSMQRTVLASYTSGVAPQDFRFSNNEHGKPALAPEFEALALHFNLSHTQGLVAMAVSHAPALGVDVENVRARTTALQIADRYFTSREADALAGLPANQQIARFYALWTLKESWLKAIGQGLSAGLDNVSFELDTAHRMISAEFANDESRCWNFWQHTPSTAHVLALAQRRPAAGVPMRVVTHRFCTKRVSGQEEGAQA